MFRSNCLCNLLTNQDMQALLGMLSLECCRSFYSWLLRSCARNCTPLHLTSTSKHALIGSGYVKLHDLLTLLWRAITVLTYP